MLTNNLKKFTKALHQRKHRQKYGKFLVEGSKSCLEVIRNIPDAVDMIIASQDWLEDSQIKRLNDKIIVASEKDINTISSVKTNKHVICILHADFEVNSSYETNWIIHLDNVQDPGNVGTIIRIADWYGIHKVSLSPQSAQLDNPKVIQSCMGSYTRVIVEVNTWEDISVKHEGMPVYVADLDGKSLFNVIKPNKGILVIGNEGKGPSKSIRNQAVEIITIQGGGQAESLNASVSCGICCSYFMS